MNQYKIAVCDDDIYELDNLCIKISLVLEEHNANFNISRFMSGESLIDAVIGQKEKFDILFLDIIMDKINGIKTARKIREEDADIGIVFITNSPNFVFEGYDVRALHYILKPVDTEKLSQTLLYDWNKKNEKNYMDVKLKDSVNRIFYVDILYLESKGRMVIITTKNGDYETYGTLRQFLNILPPNQFIACHKSYVVNLNYVSQITRTAFTTTNNQIIPISRNYYSVAKKAFINFIGNGK